MKFRHSGLAGDAVYALPAALDYARRQGVDQPTLYLDPKPQHWGAAPLLLPLLAAQPEWSAVELYGGQEIDVDLDRFRELHFDLGRGCLARHYTFFLPACPDLSRPWLAVEPDPRSQGRIVVNRTSRYRNPGVSYRFLSRYPNLLFVGVEAEYHAVRAEVGAALEWVRTTDYLELARLIAGGRLFVGNQSAGFAIAEALKAPRVLEVCPYCPNVIPHGPAGWDALYQPMFEQIVALLTDGEPRRGATNDSV